MDAPAAVGHVLDLEDRPAATAVRVVLLGIEGVEVAPDHHLDERLGADLVLVEGADIGAIAQHRDPVGKLVDLGHAVADVDDGEAVAPELADQLEQLLGLARRERGGRLVHDQDLGIGVQGAGDFDLLLLGDRQGGDRGALA